MRVAFSRLINRRTMATSSEDETKKPTPVKVRPQPGTKRTKRILVTGGAGFVGSHVCEYLVNRGDDVSGTHFLRSILCPRPPPLVAPPRSLREWRANTLVDGLLSTPSPCSSQVICMDNFFTGAKDNIKHLIGKPNFEVIRHDVVEPILLEVDQIYHLACPASPIHYKYVRCPRANRRRKPRAALSCLPRSDRPLLCAPLPCFRCC